MRSFFVALLTLAWSAAEAQENEPAKAEPAKAEPAKAEPAKNEPAKAEPAGVTAPIGDDSGFAFGSYGRINAGTDLRGGTPEPVKVVNRGPRVVENNYTELDFIFRTKTQRGVRVRTWATLALMDPLFHYTGDFDTSIAVRNLYAEADFGNGYGAWVGSRMYRGDDIYLLDFWPLDDVNTVGTGAWYRKDAIEAGVHTGLNRLFDPYQFQTRTVPGAEVDPETIVSLDRQRFISTAKVSMRVLGDGRGPSAKLKLYGELHNIGSGTRVLQDETTEELPADFGWMLGAQLGAWGFAEGRSHANFFVRYARGLAAFDELAVPTGIDTRKKTRGASELLFGTSSNVEIARGGVLVGAYSRRFVDADGNHRDRDDGWEYVVDLRPHYLFWRELGAAVDLSYQARFPRGISPTAGIALDPAIFQIAPMLIYAPFGPSSYARPQFRLTYRAAHLNQGARDLYPITDPRRDRRWVHYLGLQAEWWFNSTYRR